MFIILAGDYGTGKTTFVKENFLNTSAKVNLFAIIKNDYKAQICSDRRKYIENAVTKINEVFIIDEAANFFSDSKPRIDNPNEKKQLIFLGNARKCNNFIVAIYHDIGEIPAWLLKKSQILVRFRTNDMLQYQRARLSSFPNIINSFDVFPTLNNFQCHEIKIR